MSPINLNLPGHSAICNSGNYDPNCPGDHVSPSREDRLYRAECLLQEVEAKEQKGERIGKVMRENSRLVGVLSFVLSFVGLFLLFAAIGSGLSFLVTIGLSVLVGLIAWVICEEA